MSDAFVIEVDGDAVGVQLVEREDFRFVASNRDHLPLEGRLFRTPTAAERAAIEARRGFKAA